MTPRSGPDAPRNGRRARPAHAVAVLAALVLVLLGPGAMATAAAPVPPQRPGSVTVVAGDQQLHVAWSVPAGGGAVSSFRVEVRLGYSTFGTLVSRMVLVPSARSLTVPGLTNGTVHGVRVVAVGSGAVGSAGESAAGSVYATPRSVPPGPFALTTIGSGPGVITVGWSAASPGTYPVVRYGIALYRGYQGLAGPPAHLEIRRADQQRLVTFTGLTPGAYYYVKVIASDDRVVPTVSPAVVGHQTQADRLHGYLWGTRPQ